jgi:hypothetical protein
MTRSELAERIRAGGLENIKAMSDDELLTNFKHQIAAVVVTNLDPSTPRGTKETIVYATVPPIPPATELRRDALAGIAETDENTLIRGFVSCLDCGEIPPAKILDPLIAQAQNELHLQHLLIIHPDLSIHQYAPNQVKPSHRPTVKFVIEENQE